MGRLSNGAAAAWRHQLVTQQRRPTPRAGPAGWAASWPDSDPTPPSLGDPAGRQRAAPGTSCPATVGYLSAPTPVVA